MELEKVSLKHAKRQFVIFFSLWTFDPYSLFDADF